MSSTGQPPPEAGSKTFADVVALTPQPPPPMTRPTRGSHKGEIAGFFPADLLSHFNRPFRFALIGKFSNGRPEMPDIHAFFKAQDFQEQYAVGLLNPRHILIRFHGEKDFLRFYSRKLWYVGEKDHPMRVFKWTPDFHADRESSLVPIWFKFPALPVQFFNKDALFFLASLFGTPLRLDAATASLKRPSVARIQVEIDLLQDLPTRLWIGLGENHGFWQKFEPDEDLPYYCQYCWHVGHSESHCTVKNPELKSKTNADAQVTPQEPLNASQRQKTHTRMEYRPKHIQQVATEPRVAAEQIPEPEHQQPKQPPESNHQYKQPPESNHQSPNPPLPQSDPHDDVPVLKETGPSEESSNPMDPPASSHPKEPIPANESPPNPTPLATDHESPTQRQLDIEPRPGLEIVPLEQASASEDDFTDGINSEPELSHSQDEGWQTKRRRKPYQKRTFGPSNIATRSQASTRNIPHD